MGIFDGDYASLTFSHADPAKGQVYDQALINAVVTSPRVMRQMPRLLREAGLELVVSLPYVLAEIGRADFWVSAHFESLIRKLLPTTGLMTEAEANTWYARRQTFNYPQVRLLIESPVVHRSSGTFLAT